MFILFLVGFGQIIISENVHESSVDAIATPCKLNNTKPIKTYRIFVPLFFKCTLVICQVSSPLHSTLVGNLLPHAMPFLIYWRPPNDPYGMMSSGRLVLSTHLCQPFGMTVAVPFFFKPFTHRLKLTGYAVFRQEQLYAQGRHRKRSVTAWASISPLGA